MKLEKLKAKDANGKMLRNILGCIIFSIVVCILSLTVKDPYIVKIINLSLIYIVLSLSLNLINGFTGLFSLGHYGFMAIGGYTVGILTISAEAKENYYMIEPIYPVLLNAHTTLVPALLIGGFIAAIMGFLISLPVLKLNDDYLAIASLGFAEIILVFIRSQPRITNAAMGIKGVPQNENTLFYGLMALIAIVIITLITTSSYGNALLAIREDEIAAKSVGIKAYKHKVISFTIGSFFAGIGGGLLASLLGTVNQIQYNFQLTFNILLIVVLGGLGKIWGTVLAAVIITSALEYLRILDGAMDNFLFKTEGLPGLRLVVFSLLLIIVVIVRSRSRMRKRKSLLEAHSEVNSTPESGPKIAAKIAERTDITDTAEVQDENAGSK